ncbi:MAG: hypothetical protein ABUL72_03835, partial [Armatimonadota bacterium]
GVLGSFVYAFTYKVDDTISADGVEIRSAAVPVKATKQTMFVQYNLKNGAPVKAGDSVGSFVFVGEDSGLPLAMKAPTDGVFRRGEIFPIDVVKEGDVLFWIDDPNTISVEATLKGDSAPNARVGMEARISGITIEPVGDTLLRAADGANEWISGDILGKEVKKVLEKGLVGTNVSSRIDQSLVVKKVSEVAVDARLKSTPSTGQANTQLEPTASTVLKAKVIEGTHVANVQLSNLPPELQKQAEEAVREAVKGKAVRTSDGKTLQADQLDFAH